MAGPCTPGPRATHAFHGLGVQMTRWTRLTCRHTGITRYDTDGIRGEYTLGVLYVCDPAWSPGPIARVGRGPEACAAVRGDRWEQCAHTRSMDDG